MSTGKGRKNDIALANRKYFLMNLAVMMWETNLIINIHVYKFELVLYMRYLEDTYVIENILISLENI